MPRGREARMLDEHDLRKAMLMGNKSERIIFAATPALKEAVQFLSTERCMTISAYLTSLIVEDALQHREVLPDDICE